MIAPNTSRVKVLDRSSGMPLFTTSPPAPRVCPTIHDSYVHVHDAPDSRGCHVIWGRLGGISRGSFEIGIAVELLPATALRWLG